MAFRNKFRLVLSEKVKVGPKNVHKEVGSALIPFPTLEDYGIQAAPALYSADDEKEDAARPQQERKGIKAGTPVYENGIPVYDDPKFDWLQSAIVTSVQIKVRNKYSKGMLKPGMQIPEDFEQLTAETARTGEALALRRDARADFETFLRSLNKKEAVVVKLGDLFWNSNKVLATVSAEYLKAIKVYTERWVGQLDAAKGARYRPKIQELQDSINSAASEDDEDDLMAEGSTEQKAA